MSTTQTGKVKFFNTTKGFGFIIDDETGKEVFVHATGINSKRELMANDLVSYEVKEGQKGVNAVNVEVTG